MKITQRLIFLFLIISFSFSAFIYLFFQIKKQESELLKQADVLQRRQIINAFIDSKKTNLVKTLDSFSLNSSLKSFAEKKAPGWAYQNLNRVVSDGELDLIQVYDSTGTLVFSTSSPLVPQLQNKTFPPEFYKTLRDEKIKYFTDSWNQQFMQVGAATIHAEADSSRKTPPAGLLVIGRLWDNAFLEDFSQTLDYNVRIYLSEPTIDTKHPLFNINIVIPLKTWNNLPIAWLRFRATNPFVDQLQNVGKSTILGILLFTLIFILLQFALLYQWINSPLKMISNSLRRGNPEIIHPISQKNNEFGEIARLIKRFFEQNQQLRMEMEERRKTEMLLRQAQKMESIGTLAGGIAHDFNNLITIISGYIAIASSKVVKDKDIYNNLEESLKACHRAKSLIEKILTFSRQTEKTVKPVPMASLVNDTIELLHATIPTSITIETRLESSSFVLADPTEIQQVVLNIASNSYHAMRYQGGTLTFELTDYTGEQVHQLVPAADNKFDYVCLSVSDTGTGIPQEALERIFDPYYSTKQPGEGTGLGLSIVHGIVTGCNGYILINSIISSGTTLKVFLPITTLREPEHLDTGDNTRFVPARILFVDDEAALAELFRESLSSLGYQVTAFSDSTQALAEFLKSPQEYDLMIADIAMPKLNGINLSAKVLAARADFPIILYTGYSDANIQNSCKELGIEHLIQKPILPATLAQVVRQVLK